jgi:hypothetical protein
MKDRSHEIELSFHSGLLAAQVFILQRTAATMNTCDEWYSQLINTTPRATKSGIFDHDVSRLTSKCRTV